MSVSDLFGNLSFAAETKITKEDSVIKKFIKGVETQISLLNGSTEGTTRPWFTSEKKAGARSSETFKTYVRYGTKKIILSPEKQITEVDGKTIEKPLYEFKTKKALEDFFKSLIDNANTHTAFADFIKNEVEIMNNTRNETKKKGDEDPEVIAKREKDRLKRAAKKAGVVANPEPEQSAE